METYDYRKEMMSDIQAYLQENYPDFADCFTMRSFDKLYDELWVADSVTGNASGSYWFNRWDAEEALCHNLDLYQEACEEFGVDAKSLDLDPESMDVTIRCYLLHSCLAAVLDVENMSLDD